MNCKRVVAAVVLVCGISASQLSAQAAAETVLTHGLSSTAGSSLGKTLGNAIGNAAGNLGSRLGQQTATVPPAQRISAAKAKKKTSVAVDATTLAKEKSSGSLVASIEGAAPSNVAAMNCPAVSKSGETNSSQSATPATTSPSVAGAAKNCAAAQGTDSHPSVVNLPAAK